MPVCVTGSYWPFQGKCQIFTLLIRRWHSHQGSLKEVFIYSQLGRGKYPCKGGFVSVIAFVQTQHSFISLPQSLVASPMRTFETVTVLTDHGESHVTFNNILFLPCVSSNEHKSHECLVMTRSLLGTKGLNIYKISCYLIEFGM